MLRTLKIMWADPQNRLLLLFLSAAYGFGCYAGIKDGFDDVKIWLYWVTGVSVFWFILSFITYSRK